MKPTLLLTAVFLHAASLMAGSIELLSRLPPNRPPSAGGDGDSYAPVVSPDGRFVLFTGDAQNLASASSTSSPPPAILAPLQVYLRDQSAGTTVLVSANPAGLGGDSDSIGLGISADGRLALLSSDASDLVPEDGNEDTDIFIRDVVLGSNYLVSVSKDGGSAAGASRDPVMSADARYVAFVSDADDLVPGDNNGIPDVFVRDMELNQTMLVSVGAKATSSAFTDSSEQPMITPDGRYVVFSSTATNLVPGAPKTGHIFVRDLVGQTTTWASTGAPSASVCFNHAISSDGQVVAYQASVPGAAAGQIIRFSLSSGVSVVINTNAAVSGGLDVTADGRFVAFVASTNGTPNVTTCILVYDHQTGTTTLASGTTNGLVPAGSTADWPAIDSTGRYVVFQSNASGLVTNALFSEYNLYVRDLQQGQTVLVNADAVGNSSDLSFGTSFSVSTNGLLIAFDCPDGTLLPWDDNGHWDVFARDVALSQTELVSARNPALPSLTPNNSSDLAAYCFSADGRFVAYTSLASDLVPNDTNFGGDLFVADLLTGSNQLVTISTNGFVANQMSDEPSISADGRFVAFKSWADDLVEGDTNVASDVFLRDLKEGHTVLVSAKYSGPGSGNYESYSPILSADGRYVLFNSRATDLNSSRPSPYVNLFLRDVVAGTNYALPTKSASQSGDPTGVMTPDGLFVAYRSASVTSASLFLWDTLGAKLVYSNSPLTGVPAISPDGNRIAAWLSTPPALTIIDRATGTTNIVTQVPVPASSRLALHFSADGRLLVYTGAPEQKTQVYLYDLEAGTNMLLSRSYPSGEAGNGHSDSPQMTADGRFVVFRSAASDLVPGDLNDVFDIFLADTVSNTTVLVSASRTGAGTANDRSSDPFISSNGEVVAFASWASDLVEHDRNRNLDLFVYRLSPPRPVANVALVANGAGATVAAITWRTWPGTDYAVEFKNSLADPAWQMLETAITTVGDQAQALDPQPATTQRFYRVVSSSR